MCFQHSIVIIIITRDNFEYNHNKMMFDLKCCIITKHEQYCHYITDGVIVSHYKFFNCMNQLVARALLVKVCTILNPKLVGNDH